MFVLADILFLSFIFMKNPVWFLVFLLLVAACGKNICTINGTIAEGEVFPEGQLIYLYCYDADSDDFVVLDSTAVADGHFTLKAPVDPWTSYSIKANLRNRSKDDYTWRYSIVPEKGTVQFVFSSEWNNCVFEEGALNKSRDAYDKMKYALKEEYKKIISSSTNKEVSLQSWMQKRKDSFLRTIEQNRNNIVGREALLQIIEELSLEEIDSILALCHPLIAKNEVIVEERNIRVAEKETSEGKPFKDFSGKTPEGADIRLSDYVGKGRWVLVEFWSSWCGACMNQLPNVKKTHETLSGDKFTVLGVAVWDKDNTASARCMKEKEMTWPQIFVGDDHTAADIYGLPGVPTFILFAPDGTIYNRDNGLRGKQMMETVRDIIFGGGTSRQGRKGSV